MKLVVVGAGYVGLVSATCFAEMGNDVLCIDKDPSVVSRLREATPHFYEPRLSELLRNNIDGSRIRFDNNLKAAMAEQPDMVFIAVGTPPEDDGSADLSALEMVLAELATQKCACVIAIKSTVPMGTAARLRLQTGLDVVSNPEFMKEGAAVDDFLKPARIVVGTLSPVHQELFRALYAPFCRTSDRIMFMDSNSAELSKYASNLMLATRISFMNEMSRIASAFDADIENVRKVVGSDPRIGASYLFAGHGFGGSCLPKDSVALRAACKEKNLNLSLISAVVDVNRTQRQLLIDLWKQKSAKTGTKVAVWGLSFKPGTDDIRESPGIDIALSLKENGASVSAYDPRAMDNAKLKLGDSVSFCTDQHECLKGADALFINTEWNVFRQPDFERIKQTMNRPAIYDGRNLYNPAQMKRMGFEYYSIGRHNNG